MYATFFGLQQQPFSIAPDPRFLFMSEMHREALAHLLYGVGGGGGFVLLTGEIGAGKTTVCRAFLEQVPAHCDVAYIFNPKLSAIELLRAVCDEFHVAVPAGAGSVKEHVDALNRYLLAAFAAGRQAVLVIDEAQGLDVEVLEQLRLLTNLETAERKLLQIVLIGQPELRTLLATPALEQLAQRVIARYHLPALAARETGAYVRHRLAVAGAGAAAQPFDDRVLARVHALAGGVPRRINLLCDRALLGAYAQGRAQVDMATVEQAAREVFAAPAAAHGAWRPPARALPVAVVGAGLLATLAWAWLMPMPLTSPPTLPLRAAGWLAASAASPAPAAVAALASAPRASGAAGTAVVVAAAAASVAAVPASLAAAAAPASAVAASATAADLASIWQAAHRAEGPAWRELAARWNLALPAGSDPCVAAAQAGWACFRSQGGLAAARQLDRPGLIALRDGSRPAVWVVLSRLTDDRAWLQVGEQRWPLPLPMLARLWRGEFATLWQRPAGLGETADAAATAAGRDWLQSTLAAIGHDDRDAPLKSRVWDFQVAQGLVPDGLAGPMTQMLLQRAATGRRGEPRLAAGPNDGGR